MNGPEDLPSEPGWYRDYGDHIWLLIREGSPGLRKLLALRPFARIENASQLVAASGGVSFTRERIRAELIASLPADPKWATWVDGVLDRLEASS